MAESRHCPPMSRFCWPEAPCLRPEAAASVCLPLLSVHRSWRGTWLPLSPCWWPLDGARGSLWAARAPLTCWPPCRPALLGTLCSSTFHSAPTAACGGPWPPQHDVTPLTVGEMTARGLSEPYWVPQDISCSVCFSSLGFGSPSLWSQTCGTQVSRLCSWAQNLSCLPWASRPAPASAPTEGRPSRCMLLGSDHAWRPSEVAALLAWGHVGEWCGRTEELLF